MSVQPEFHPLPPDPKPFGKRMSSEDRRRQIVRVAMQLFSENGFDGTTTKEISVRVGVSEAVIFRHFAGKHDLYAAILDEKCRETDEVAFLERIERLMAERDDRGLFETLARRMLENHRRDDTFLRLMLFSALENHELSEMFYETRVQEIFGLLAGYIRRRMSDGDFRETDPLMAARSFIGMVNFQVLTEQLLEKKSPKRDIDELCRTFTDIFLAGMSSGVKRDE